MTRLLERRLAELRAEQKLAFVPFLVVGDPSPEGFLAYVDTLVAAGADALELGLPYSDPPADGPVIQAADQRALAANVTPASALDLIAGARARHPSVPASLLVYHNLVLQAGVGPFYARARAAGVDAVLVADVPLELSGPLVAAARAHDVAPVFLASAVTTDARARRLAEVAEGYIYAAARVGVTGAKETLDGGPLTALVDRLRQARIGLPVLAGFGLSTPAHVAAARSAGADGVIVGSALVAAAAEKLPDPAAAAAALFSLAARLAAAAHSQEENPC